MTEDKNKNHPALLQWILANGQSLHITFEQKLRHALNHSLVQMTFTFVGGCWLAWNEQILQDILVGIVSRIANLMLMHPKFFLYLLMAISDTQDNQSFFMLLQNSIQKKTNSIFFRTYKKYTFDPCLCYSCLDSLSCCPISRSKCLLLSQKKYPSKVQSACDEH